VKVEHNLSAMSSNKKASGSTDNNLEALVQDARDFGKQPLVPMGNVAAENDNGGDDISAISFQSSRSIKDKIKIVQDEEETETKEGEGLSKKLQGFVKERIHIKHVQRAYSRFKDASTKHWEGIQQNTYNTFETMNTKSNELVNDKIKPGLKHISDSSKQLVDSKIKPGWEQSVGVAKDIPGYSKAAALKVRDASMQQYETHVNPRMGKIREFHYSKSQYYMGKAPAVFESVDMSELKYELAQIVLLSIGIILQCENPITGGIIWLALLLASPIVAISGLSSLLAAMAFQRFFLSINTTDLAWMIRAGANCFLVGAVMAALVEFPASSFFLQVIERWIVAVVLGPTCMFVHLQLFSSPLTTFPPLLWSYNLVMGVVIMDFGLWGQAWLRALAPDDDDPAASEQESYSIVGATLCSISAIFGVANPWSGLFILFGVCLCSRILATWLVTASFTASLLGMAFQVPALDANAGMAGYQAALTAVTCAYYFVPSKRLVVVSSLAILWTCILESAVATVFYKLMYVHDSIDSLVTTMAGGRYRLSSFLILFFIPDANAVSR
jgi:urea transporter